MTDNEVSATPSPIDVPSETAQESTESFADQLSQFERSHLHKSEDSPTQLEGTVVSVTADSVYLDIGYKTEGVLLRSAFPNNADAVMTGDKFPVSVKGRNEERYYELSLQRLAAVKDWSRSLGRQRQ